MSRLKGAKNSANINARKYSHFSTMPILRMTMLVTKALDALTTVIDIRQSYYLMTAYVNIPLNVNVLCLS